MLFYLYTLVNNILQCFEEVETNRWHEKANERRGLQYMYGYVVHVSLYDQSAT